MTSTEFIHWKCVARKQDCWCRRDANKKALSQQHTADGSGSCWPLLQQCDGSNGETALRVCAGGYTRRITASSSCISGWSWKRVNDYSGVKSAQWDVTQILSSYKLSGSGQQKEWNFLMCYWMRFAPRATMCFTYKIPLTNLVSKAILGRLRPKKWFYEYPSFYWRWFFGCKFQSSEFSGVD